MTAFIIGGKMNSLLYNYEGKLPSLFSRRGLGGWLYPSTPLRLTAFEVLFDYATINKLPKKVVMAMRNPELSTKQSIMLVILAVKIASSAEKASSQ